MVGRGRAGRSSAAVQLSRGNSLALGFMGSSNAGPLLVAGINDRTRNGG